MNTSRMYDGVLGNEPTNILRHKSKWHRYPYVTTKTESASGGLDGSRTSL
jgi:hypothetical protein